MAKTAKTRSKTGSKKSQPKSAEGADHVSPEAEAQMDELVWQLTSHRHELVVIDTQLSQLDDLIGSEKTALSQHRDMLRCKMQDRARLLRLRKATARLVSALQPLSTASAQASDETPLAV
ncbi:hypothetical protein PSQ90_15295 [Devosia rhodophyticola]|uniref:DUF465 domain-containing protein n=1 Tax=Devosia rhodophyticola TaxID=3026423 RepID=A0ABY7YW68_9HYPH|nr:hypothetical protein [Devosia rhodophyticola]WDR05613.1 hypothetical protein PSQ90_15295 [Devosia rhodophyticola]